MCQNLKYLSLTVIFLCNLLANNLFAEKNRFKVHEHIITDTTNNIEWLRCSVGQRWDGYTCIGKIVNLSLERVPDATRLANEQLGGKWRLPTKKELQSIVCKSCPSPKIDKKIFPNTDNAPYWTGDRSSFNKKFFVSVNFHTGFAFNRFLPLKELAIRLVRDKKK